MVLAFLLLLVVLIMTQTRSAWIGCFALVVGYGLVYDRRMLVPILIAAPVAFVIPAIDQRIDELTSNHYYIGGAAVMLNSYAWRKLLWEIALAYVWVHPILGYGLHSFFFYSREFFSATPEGTYAHNDYIQILFETGLVGLVAFLWIFVRCLVWLFQRRLADKAAAASAGATLVAYLICSYSDNLLEYLPFQWEFWFPFSVMCWPLQRHYLRTDASQLATRSKLTEPRSLSPVLQ